MRRFEPLHNARCCYPIEAVIASSIAVGEHDQALITVGGRESREKDWGSGCVLAHPLTGPPAKGVLRSGRPASRWSFHPALVRQATRRASLIGARFWK